MPGCREWPRPHRHLHGLWEALVFDIAVKQHLLQYATSALFFADKKVDPQLVTWNRWGSLQAGVWYLMSWPPQPHFMLDPQLIT